MYDLEQFDSQIKELAKRNGDLTEILLIEEMGELMQAVSKLKRNIECVNLAETGYFFDNVLNEIADVYITLMQFIEFFGNIEKDNKNYLETILVSKVAEKLDRTYKRFEGGGDVYYCYEYYYRELVCEYVKNYKLWDVLRRIKK